MKPDAPVEYRGAYRPIKTNVPGIDICEHLPLHARVADKYALIRSIAHKFADHGGGHKRLPDRPRSAGTDRLRQRLSRRRLDGRQDARGGPPRRAELHLRHRTGPRRHRRVQLRLGVSRHLHAPLQCARRSERSEVYGPQCVGDARGRRSAGRKDGAAARPRKAARLRRSEWRRRGDGSVQAAGAVAGDDRHRPQSLRPDPGIRKAARALRNARLGPALPDGAAPGRTRGELRDDGAGESLPGRHSDAEATAPTTGTRTPSTATSSTTRKEGCPTSTGRSPP